MNEADTRRQALEDAARIADSADWLRCETCGAVQNDYAPEDCAYRKTWMETDDAKRMIFLDGAYAATRYFEKRICRPEQMYMREIGPAIAAAIRALAASESTP